MEAGEGHGRREPDASAVPIGPHHAHRRRVEFVDGVRIPYRDGAEEEIRRLEIGPWDDLAAAFPGIALSRLFTALPPEEIQTLSDRARDLDRTYRPPNLSAYFAIECPIGVRPESLAEALADWDCVEAAYVERPPAPPPLAATPGDDPRFPNQGYLKKAPEGIDAEYGWTFAGGDGKGIHFIDVEKGWMLNHEDLAGANITLVWGQNTSDFDHGTASLGVVVAVDNQAGGVGIAPQAPARVVSEFDQLGVPDRPNALLHAVAALQFGDVLLLEQQALQPHPIDPTQKTLLMPVETDGALCDLIRLATALGITTIEPAGNGAWNLDSWTDPVKGQLLNPASNDFRDSGAVMVGAATSTTPHIPIQPKDVPGGQATNRGGRVDCYAWGQNVDTCWTDASASTSDYTTGFAGTSSASAIIAGAALVVQGVAEASLKRRFSAWQLREILRDEILGTPAENPPEVMVGDPAIGVMPDLKAILATKLKVTPDLYLRDFVGDTGDPHTGAVSASPDVILRPTKVADGQKAFGQGSGTENSNTLGQQAVAQQDNHIYVRVQNRGPTAATNVTATVFWAQVATLVTPANWTKIGSTTLAVVPGLSQLTVSDPITWPANDVPGPGHYCYVGLIGNADDAAPALADLGTWDTFVRLIRDNNNVTWRNFNVVPNQPPPPSDHLELPFLAPGAPEFARVFGFEVAARLPEGSEAWLEMPTYLLDLLGLRSPSVKLVHRDVVRLPVNPRGMTPLGEALLAGNSNAELRLWIRIPEESRERESEILVSQLYEGQEVGRVTWRLVPPGQDQRIGVTP